MNRSGGSFCGVQKASSAWSGCIPVPDEVKGRLKSPGFFLQRLSHQELFFSCLSIKYFE